MEIGTCLEKKFSFTVATAIILCSFKENVDKR